MGAAPRTDGRSDVLRGSAAMLVSTAVTGLGGLVFWLLAARTSSAADVGTASALFQVVLLANFGTSLGLPIVIARLATGTGERSKAIFGLAVVLRAAASVLSISFFLMVALGDDVAEPLRSLPAGLGVTMYLWLAVGAALAVIVEVRLVALRAWGWVIIRASAAALLRLPLVLVSPFADEALWLTLVAAGAPALTGWIGAAVLTKGPELNLRFSEVDARIRRYAVSNWLGLVATLGPAFAIPVIVAFQVPSEEHASFSIAWSIALMVFQVPHLTGSVLLAEGSRLGSERRPLLESLASSLGATGLATAVTIVGADLVPRLYGDDFADAADILPLVTGATIGWAVVSTMLSLCRMRDDNLSVVIISTIYAVLTLAITGIGAASDGTVGAAAGWLIANSAAALASIPLALRSKAPADDIGLAEPTLAVDA